LWANQEIRINMTKNMTRKGLAFGAGFALIASGLAGVPAQAAGVVDDSVSLAPTAGKAYAVLTADAFDLSANYDASLETANRFLKFLVADASENIAVDVTTTGTASALGQSTLALNIMTPTTVVAGSNLVTVTQTGHGLISGDTVKLSEAVTGLDQPMVAGNYEVTRVGANSYTLPITHTSGTAVFGGTISLAAINIGNASIASADADFTIVVTADAAQVSRLFDGETVTVSGASNNGSTDGGTAAGGAAAINGARVITKLTATTFGFESTNSDIDTVGDDMTFTVLADTGISLQRNAIPVSARDATDKSFVVGGADTVANDSILTLISTSAATYSVDVTAWVDNNGNNEIDATEKASPARTVTFQKASAIVPSLTWTPVLMGDDKMVAEVTLTPKINWSQADKTDFYVAFNRQSSSETINTDAGVANITESWSNTTGIWSVEAILTQTVNATPWDDINKQANFDESALSKVAKNGKTVTITTTAAHSIKVNDKITIAAVDDNDALVNSYAESIFAATAARVTSVTATTFTYDVAANTVDVAETTSVPDGTQNFDFTIASFGRAAAGTYQASVFVGATPAKIGSTFSTTAVTAVAAGVTNAAVVGNNVSTAFKVRSTTTGTVSVVSSVANAAGTAVSAGVPVRIAVTETSAGTVVVNGTTVTTSGSIDTVTDASGAVTINVTNSSAVAGETVGLTVTSQGSSDASTLTWEGTSFSLTDVKDVSTTASLIRTMEADGTLSFDLQVRDQFNIALAAEARVKVVLGGTRWSATSYQVLNGGVATVTVTDSATAADADASVTFSVQQKNSSGIWGDADGVAPRVTMASSVGEFHLEDIEVDIQGVNSDAILFDANAVSDADLSALVASKAIAASDTRLGQTAVTFSATVDDSVNVSGTVVDSISESGALYDGAQVTLSGPSNMLFRSGAVSSFGSITIYAAASGAFDVAVYSNTAQKDTVITATYGSVSKTVKVTFVATDATSGAGLTLIAPMYVTPASTFTVKGQLNDAYGNGIDTAAASMLATYTGPGLTVGALPTQTDASGSLSYSVLLGANDTGSIIVVISYDQNGDGDFTDSTDLSVSQTITIGEAPSAAKVNVGSFKGFVALYAKGYAGQKMSAIVAGKWIVVASLASDFERVVRYTGAGYTITTKIYIDGVQIGDAFTTMTK
jgi:hypothetical protein